MLEDKLKQLLERASRAKATADRLALLSGADRFDELEWSEKPIIFSLGKTALVESLTRELDSLLAAEATEEREPDGPG